MSIYKNYPDFNQETRDEVENQEIDLELEEALEQEKNSWDDLMTQYE